MLILLQTIPVKTGKFIARMPTYSFPLHSCIIRLFQVYIIQLLFSNLTRTKIRVILQETIFSISEIFFII